VQRFVPDLAIEIASTNDTFNDLLRKKDRYRQAGTAEVWLFSENQEIMIFSESGDRILHAGDTITSAMVPGFSVTVDELYRGL
jgi:Uma2 family endonuclease